MKYTKKFELEVRIGGNNVQYWRREWQPTPVFLPGESHGQRNLVRYIPWGLKKLDMTNTISTAVYSVIIVH